MHSTFCSFLYLFLSLHLHLLLLNIHLHSPLPIPYSFSAPVDLFSPLTSLFLYLCLFSTSSFPSFYVSAFTFSSTFVYVSFPSSISPSPLPLLLPLLLIGRLVYGDVWQLSHLPSFPLPLLLLYIIKVSSVILEGFKERRERESE